MGHGKFWIRAHEGKTPYDSKEDAEIAAARLQHLQKQKVRVYICAVCEKYHVGSNRKGGRQEPYR